MSDKISLDRCTNNFSRDRSLGGGAYGTVYHGTDLEGERFVEFAAKRLECQDPEPRPSLTRIFHCCLRSIPESPKTNISATSAPKYPYRKHFKSKVYDIEVHGPFGNMKD